MILYHDNENVKENENSRENHLKRPKVKMLEFYPIICQHRKNCHPLFLEHIIQKPAVEQLYLLLIQMSH